MPSDLVTLSGQPLIREYAQGRAQDAIDGLADFIAPPVDVALHTGKYSKYNSKNRFRIPDTLRGLGGDATRLEFSRTDGTYNCEPHALDVPLDNIEIDEDTGNNLLMEAADDAAYLGGLAHADKVITTAVSSATTVAGKGEWSNDEVDPVEQINDTIVAIYKASGAGPTAQVGMVIDPDSLMAFFANPNVKTYFPGIEAIAPTVENFNRLFIGNTDPRVSFIAKNTAAAGKDASMEWSLTNTVLFFARTPSPTRRSPDFMKTFRVRGRWMTPGSYDRQDGRGQTVKMDWSEDVQVVNSVAGKKFAIT